MVFIILRVRSFLIRETTVVFPKPVSFAPAVMIRDITIIPRVKISQTLWAKAIVKRKAHLGPSQPL